MDFWQETNCSLRYKSSRQQMTGRDPITRAPIYDEKSHILDVFLNYGGKAVCKMFPGADETSEYFAGYLLSSQEWPEDLNNLDEIGVTFIDDPVEHRGQIYRTYSHWTDDFALGNTGEDRRTGDRIFVKMSRNEVFE